MMLKTAIAIGLALTGAASAREYPKYQTIFQFKRTDQGRNSSGNLIQDASGALYGTTTFGGSKGEGGVVFRLNPPAHGRKKWTESVLWRFEGRDGDAPAGALVMDSAGALYGVTSERIAKGAGIFGTVFKLTPPAAGQSTWTLQTLVKFKGSITGGEPLDGLIMDSAGALYGTTTLGGGRSGTGYGTVFKLSPPAPGSAAWSLHRLFAFKDFRKGVFPACTLLAGPNGVLYGLAAQGGTKNGGTAFQLSPPAQPGQEWTYDVLWDFDPAKSGNTPVGTLVADDQGRLIGTAAFGGAYDAGTVFALTPPASGGQTWSETTLFTFDGTTGAVPQAGVVPDGTGGYFGAASAGGAEGYGAIFHLTPPPKGSSAWQITDLRAFSLTPGDSQPAGVLLGLDGVLYGTTVFDPVHYSGGVFSITNP